MARIKIGDLQRDRKISKDEMRKITGALSPTRLPESSYSNKSGGNTVNRCSYDSYGRVVRTILNEYQDGTDDSLYIEIDRDSMTYDD